MSTLVLDSYKEEYILPSEHAETVPENRNFSNNPLVLQSVGVYLGTFDNPTWREVPTNLKDNVSLNCFWKSLPATVKLLEHANELGFSYPTSGGFQMITIPNRIGREYLETLLSAEGILFNPYEIDSVTNTLESDEDLKIAVTYPIDDVLEGYTEATRNPNNYLYVSALRRDTETPKIFRVSDNAEEGQDYSVHAIGRGSISYEGVDLTLDQIKFYLTAEEKERVGDILSNFIKPGDSTFYIGEVAKLENMKGADRIMVKMFSQWWKDMGLDSSKAPDHIVYPTTEGTVTEKIDGMRKLFTALVGVEYKETVNYLFKGAERDKNYKVVLFSK